MKEYILNNLKDILTLPEEVFEIEYRKKAFELRREIFGDTAFLTGILALGNICVNDCTYCGLRSESPVNRFRLDEDRLESRCGLS